MPTIRPAIASDIEAITEIYNTSAVATTASYALEPVSIADRRAWFDRLTAGDFPVLVVEEGGVVIGYASYGPFRSLEGYAHTVEHSVYIADGYRTGGLGRMLMSALIDRAASDRVHVMVGVIDAGNEESIAFHERLGFESTGRLPQVGRKFGRWLDVVFVTLVLD